MDIKNRLEELFDEALAKVTATTMVNFIKKIGTVDLAEQVWELTESIAEENAVLIKWAMLCEDMEEWTEGAKKAIKNSLAEKAFALQGKIAIGKVALT